MKERDKKASLIIKRTDNFKPKAKEILTNEIKNETAESQARRYSSELIDFCLQIRLYSNGVYNDSRT